MSLLRLFPACLLSAAIWLLLPAAAAESPGEAVVSAGSTQRLTSTVKGTARRSAQARLSWGHALGAALQAVQNHGAGGYSVQEDAHHALARAFLWDAPHRRLTFTPAAARPSFCSGAVYAVLLSALIHWDSPRHSLPEEAWMALKPSRVADGCGPWGYANANGPGFALLIHELRAGVNFTDINLARPGDVLKIWWNEHIGANERGHLVIFIRREGENILYWSSNLPQEGKAGGFGYRTVPVSSIRRALFSRITRPEAFAHAARIGDNAWLTSLTQQDTTWEECCRRCGIVTRPLR